MSFSLLPESALLLASLFLASNKKRSNRTSNCVACHPHCTIWLGAFSYLIKISCRNCSPSITILAVKENKRLTLKRLCGCFCHLCLIWRRKKTMWSHRKAKNGWWSEQKLRITTVPFAYLIALQSHFHFIHTPFDFNQENEKKMCKQYFNVAKWIFRHNSLSVMYFIIKSEIECRILDAPTRRWYLFVTNFTSELPSDSSSIHRWRYRFSAASSSDSPFNSQLFNYTNNVNTAF